MNSSKGILAPTGFISVLFALLLPFIAHAEPTVQTNTNLGPLIVELDSAKAPYVAVQSRTPEHGLGWHYPQAPTGHGYMTLLPTPA